MSLYDRSDFDRQFQNAQRQYDAQEDPAYADPPECLLCDDMGCDECTPPPSDESARIDEPCHGCKTIIATVDDGTPCGCCGEAFCHACYDGERGEGIYEVCAACAKLEGGAA